MSSVDGRVFLFHSGRLELTVDSETRIYGQGDFIMVECGEMHQLKAIEDTELLTIGCAVNNKNE